MASSQVHAHGDDTFSREFDTGDDDDALALLRPSSQPTMSSTKNIPKPPPLPLITYQRNQASRRKPSSLSRLVPKDAVETWDKLFKEGIGADTFVETDNKSQFPVHSSVLAAASPVMAKRLNQSLDRKRKTYLKILGVPCEAVYMFIRFLYSSCYEEEEMKKFVLHLLVLSHYYSVPSLKRVCVEVLEQGFINKENVIDVLQLSRNCDAARIFFLCFSMVIKDFKSVSSTEGWKVMKRSNPLLELELTEAVVESVTRKEERRRKAKDREMYLQLYEAMEALVHICSEGCATIGPRDKALKGSQAVCNFPACKRLEGALRHFLGCKSRASCLHCKRMWKLLQLHSCICDDSGSCEVPLCRNFKEKMKKLRKKQQSKWRLLVENIIKAKNSLGPFSSRPLNFKEKMKKLRTVSGRFLHVIWFDIRQVSVYSHKNFGFFMDSPVRYDEDVYDRIWISRTFSYYREINTSLPVLSDNNSYNLSSLVMSTAMAPTRPITMTLENSDPNVRYFVYMHFADVEDLSLTPNQAREFDISVNGVKVASSFRSKYLETNTFYLNPESQTDIGFSLVRTPKSTLPPIVNAGKEILVCLMTTFGRALIVIMIVSKLIENIVA